MARVGICAAIALLVLVVLAASAAAAEPRCCVDLHTWGNNGENTGCKGWCQSQCRGGECKPGGDHHYCHCFC